MPFTPSVGKFNNFRDSQGNNLGLRPVPLWVNTKVLSANTAYSDTIPNGATMVIISSDVNIYVNCNGTATIGTAADGSGSELNPTGYVFHKDNLPTAISAISASAGNVTFAYYKL